MSRRRFVIVGPQRSGTSVTHACVAGHPEVTVTSDELRVEPLFTRGIAAFTYGNDPWSERSRGFGALFDALTLVGENHQTHAHGLKVAVHTHDGAIDFANCLREHLTDVHVVLVRREDLVAQFGSLMRAQETGVWHSWQGGSVDGGRLRVDGGRFSSYAATCLSVVAQLRTLRRSHPFHEVVFERDIMPGRWDELFSFLGVEVMAPDWVGLHKVAPPARDYLDNYDEMVGVLRSIPLPSESDELAAATDRAARALGSESAKFLLNRAGDAFGSGHLDLAESAVFAALERDHGTTEAMRRWGYGVLEAIWSKLASAGRASAGLARLEPRWREDAGYALFAGVVRFHLGEPEVGLAELERALAIDPGLERARELLAEWRPGTGDA